MKDFLQGKWLGHPLHAALAHIPAALWPAAAVFDVLARLNGGTGVFASLGFYAIAIGLVVSLAAAPTGLADWWDIKREKPAWKLGLYHMALNLTATAVFAASLWLRWPAPATVGAIPASLSVIGGALVIVSAYLGGLMVFDQGTSVARLSKKEWRARAEAGGARVAEEK